MARLFAALGAPGVDVRFVGGCVRDAVLGRTADDLDVGTPEPPDVVTRRLSDAGIKAVPTGITHGTVTAVLQGRTLEITSLRRDVSTDGRHAVVAYTSDWTLDAERRDFTMNAMSLTPDGELHDSVKGASDARVGRLRFVGDPARRIAEDHLRLLRLFRFQAWYGQKPLSPKLLEVCHAHRALLTSVSAERIHRELAKLLSAPNPVSAISAMASSGVLAIVLPESASHENLLKLVMAEHAYGMKPRWLVRLALLAPGAAAERLKLSNAEAREFEQLTAADPEIWLGMPAVALNAALFRHGGGLVEARIALAIAHGRVLRGWGAAFDAARSWTPHPLPISGDDVVARGTPPGPSVGAALARAESLWIGSDFKASRDEILTRLETTASA
jgi:poly(A) polymerase